MQETNILDFVNNSYKLKPTEFFMDELKWKYLIRSALRGKNIMLLGPAGQGKTLAVQSVMAALAISVEDTVTIEQLKLLETDSSVTDVKVKEIDSSLKNKIYNVLYKKSRPTFSINLGSTQDARATLIGNTQFSKESGTFFQESPFVKAISTPRTIILLDELSRAHPDAVNILIPVLDNQKYLRLDEFGGSVVKVASGVSFMATANVGNEYTAARVMDKALLDRFTVKIEVDIPTADEEMELIRIKVPNADMNIMHNITQIAEKTREFSTQGKLDRFISTRSVVEMAELTIDGFNLTELAEMVIYPDYSNDGGVDSERTMIKQIVQKYVIHDE